MTLPYVADPSSAELMDRVRSKVRASDVVLDPRVSRQIQDLKKAKVHQAQTNGDEEYRTIIHLDLKSALLTGIAVQVEPLTQEPGWSVIVEGMDTEGMTLSVSAYLPKSDTEPLQIRSFCLLQD